MATGVTDSSNGVHTSTATVSDKETGMESAEMEKAVDLDNGVENQAAVCGAPSQTGNGEDTSTLKAPPAGTAMDNLFFFEDEVYRIDKKGKVKFGLVVETSESYSGDEFEDEYVDMPNKGEIRVAWHPEGREVIHSERSVGLADRTIMPADVVRRLVPGKDTQRGYCREISMRADVRIVNTNYVIKNVVTERLRLITNWQLDTAVCLDSWVGSTKGIEETLVLRSSYGSRFEVSTIGLYFFKDVTCLKSRGIFHTASFFPGQVIKGRFRPLEPIKLLTPNIPLKKNKKGEYINARYTVESIRTDSVWVHWQCKALSEDYDIKSHKVQQPEPCVTGEDLKRLKRLNLFESCMQQINDRNYLKISDCDVIVKKSEWEKEQSIKFKLIQKEQKQMETNPKLFVTNIAPSSSANSNTSHLHDKLKKKYHTLDVDKNNKTKKFALKLEKKSKDPVHASGKALVDCSTTIITNTTESATIAEVVCDTKGDLLSNDGWISEDTDEDDLDIDVIDNFDVEDASTTPTVSNCSSPTPRNSPKHQRNRSQWSKNQIDRKLNKTSSSKASGLSCDYKIPKVGTEVVTESLILYSTATVVWQDGTIEPGIPSTQLYPIHHLDTHELFPGDFVISSTEDSDYSYRDYGVIQSVDHLGRIARVKWFTTYTSAEEAKPAYKGETEMSVYDLKDHPDFQYRPGIMVIRVANFVGEDATCTAGQIIDNYIDGRVKVWWVDGHISMCWPQDLFEVGQYDQTDVGGNDSDDSWETESENSEFGCSSPKLTVGESHILSNIERARVAIARLEEIFHISPHLQNPEVMRKLLVVYKGCRYLDRLLNTNFFHEDQFKGLIERVRKGGNQTISERAQDRKNRLFNEMQVTLGSSNSKQQLSQTDQSNNQIQQPLPQSQPHNCNRQAIVPVNVYQKTSPQNSCKDFGGPKVLFNLSSTPFKHKHVTGSTAIDGNIIVPAVTTTAHKRKSSPIAFTSPISEEKQCEENQQRSELKTLLTTTNLPNSNSSLASSVSTSSNVENISPIPTVNTNLYNVEKNQLLTSAMINIEKAFEKTSQLKSTIVNSLSAQDDSGNYSRNENCDGSSTSYTSSSDLTNVEVNNSLHNKSNEDPKSVSCSSIEILEDSSPEFVCVRLCSLLKDQLVKCINEIRLKYYKDNFNLSGVLEYVVEEQGEEKSTGTLEYTEIDNKSAEDDGFTKEDLSLANVHESDKGKEAATTLSEMCQPPSVISLANVPSECFQVLSNAPKTHKFHLTIFHPNNAQQYYKAVHREHRMLRTSLPPGVWVRVFEDRMDLVSVMIEGPKKTPYEDGLFFFDIQLGREYPKSPPLCHYISYCSDRLNPNLYEDGKVCVSLLGTWTGRDTEVWGPKSTLLQVIVSIQGLILVPEPYFNEAGYEKQKDTQQGIENSRMYNEMVIIKMVQATSKLLQTPPEMFRTEIMEHYKANGMSMHERIKGWIELSKRKEEREVEDEAEIKYAPPEFPLVPTSRGFCLTLTGLLDTFHAKLSLVNASMPSINEKVV